MEHKKKEMGTVKNMKKIIALHGWTYDLEKWQEFENDLARAGFRLEILKIPGLTEKSDKVWNLDDYVQWLFRLIGQEKVILLGHSNGGRIAAAYAAKYPENIKKLILVDSAGIYHKELYLEIKRFLFKVAAKVGKSITSSASVRKLLYAMAREKDYYNASGSTKETMVNMIKSDITSKLPQIKVPTVIIWGEDDKITPLSDAMIFHEKIKGSELKIIKGGRHTPLYTHSRDIVKIIKNAF